MAKLARFFQKIFASNAGNNELSEYGSFQASPPGNLYSGSTITPDIVQNLSNFEGGQYDAVGGSYSPTIQDHNSLFWLQTRQQAYLFQEGIAEWDAETIYFTNSFVKSGSILYVSLQDNNTNHAITDGAWWYAFFIPPTVQRFITGSGTYTLPTTPRKPSYIRIKICGGGGGGSGAGSGTSGGTGGSGGESNFGSLMLRALGGTGGSSTSVGLGGPTNTSGGIVVFSTNGQNGEPGIGGNVGSTVISLEIKGGNGGSSFFGGAGQGGIYNIIAGSAVVNSGSAGGGGGGIVEDIISPNVFCGNGGGAGGYLDVIITNPDSTYDYEIGPGGLGGAVGSGGYIRVGGAGADGIIIVEEYYQ